MSEYTCVYLRRKDAILLEYKEHPNYDELKDKSQEEKKSLHKEIREYNEKVSESFGCCLFYLSTTPSRRLDEVLPWTINPLPLTFELIDSVLAFFDEEIISYKRYIQEDKNKIDKLEARIVKANVDLYDKINEEIDMIQQSISESEEELEEIQFYRSKFAFVKEILKDEENKMYELIYTKC